MHPVGWTTAVKQPLVSRDGRDLIAAQRDRSLATDPPVRL
jgi:hypothetical protein